MENYIEVNKDVKIFCRSEIQNSSTAIFLLHGLAEHSGRYDDFINVLIKNNISVFALDLRGHGKSTGIRGDIKHFDDFLNDLKIVREKIMQQYNFKKLFLFGHSIGGLIASNYVSKYPNDFQFLILSSPVVYTPRKLQIIRFIPYKIMKFITINKTHSESAEMLEYSKHDELALKKYSIRLIGNVFDSGVKELNKNLNITCPTLLVFGMQDRLLNEYEKFKSFFEEIKTKNKKLITYPNAKHRIVNNEGKEERIKDIVNWIKQEEKE